MDRQIEKYVDDLFHGYEETPALLDFKEEIRVNLSERAKDLEGKGMAEDEAFTKAVAELGDITSVADELGKKKRNEFIRQMYIPQKTEVGLPHAIGYVIAGGVLLFGIIAGCLSYFSTHQVFTGVSSLMPFLVLSGAAFVFLGLTQETANHFPMNKIRALIYSAATGLSLFGVTTAVMLYFMKEAGLQAVFGTLIPFLIPGLGILAFLLITEKNRLKPWVIEEQKMFMEHYYANKDPHRMAQGGLLSGALWLLAIAVVLLVGFRFGLIYAIAAFFAAIACQLMIEFWIRAKA